MDLYQVKNDFKSFLQKDALIPKALKFGVYKCAVPIRHIGVTIGAGMRKVGLPSRKYAPLKKLKGIHLNERCFIVCTGPSLTIGDVNRLKGEYTFSMNSIFTVFDKTDWRPTYYCVAACDVYNNICEDERFKKIENAFVPNLIYNEFEKIALTDYTLFPMETYQSGRGGYGQKPIKFSGDIYSLVCEAATVTYVAMQIAVYMGFKEIYLLGCDCNYRGAKQHIVDIGGFGFTPPPDGIEDQMRVSYQAAKEYADTHGIKIYNATRGGKLEVFERVDFDSLFTDKATE